MHEVSYSSGGGGLAGWVGLGRLSLSLPLVTRPRPVERTGRKEPYPSLDEPDPAR